MAKTVVTSGNCWDCAKEFYAVAFGVNAERDSNKRMNAFRCAFLFTLCALMPWWWYITRRSCVKHPFAGMVVSGVSGIEILVTKVVKDFACMYGLRVCWYVPCSEESGEIDYGEWRTRAKMFDWKLVKLLRESNFPLPKK